MTNKINGYNLEGEILSQRKTEETAIETAIIKSRRARELRKLSPGVLIITVA
jgi:hypothetical protein